ncbi:TlpA family protein disulfide reductase [Planctomycetes bacterium K23_9]|uniref:Thiol-disulfide oxidoreductase ResA n=1 Tax=Stieleria marina TaxID=1930275 RepID=A0A517NS73_9BACT|nr:Thiol-disulfide oxidoreductase ResA [Planctomycetes bacterium K23_9]
MRFPWLCSVFVFALLIDGGLVERAFTQDKVDAKKSEVKQSAEKTANRAAVNPKAPKEAKKSGDSKKESNDTKTVKKKPKTPAEKIRQLMSEKDFAGAAKALDAAIESGDAAKLEPMRITIATGFARSRNYGQAFEQYDKRVQYLSENLDKRSQLTSIVPVLSMARMYGMRAKRKDQVDELFANVARKVHAATKENTSKYLDPISQLAVLNANHNATGEDDYEKARGILADQLQRFDALEVGADEEVDLLIATLRLKSAKARFPGTQPAEIEDLDQFLASAIEAHPDSMPLLTEYAQVEVIRISQLYSVSPDQAQERIDRLREIIEEKGEGNRLLTARIRQLDSLETRIESARKLLAMVGKPAPDFDIESWVNEGDTTLESLKGKVVLVDFWSVWCGPCIMTFPHLREWREEFQDKGFEIVGVTRYYNYKWDDKAERAVRAPSGDKASPEDEREMLVSFLKHHELQHPTIITPKNSKMQSEFGVTGIPHVVLIDRDGKVQMVKVGAGAKTASEIHAKLAKLIEQE